MRRGLGRALATTLLGGVGIAVAGAEPPVTLQWKAPLDVCPDAAYVLGEVDRLLGGSVGGTTVRAKATVTVVQDTRFKVQLVTTVTSNGVARQGTRSLEAPTCRKLADATALVLALAVDPDRVVAVSASAKASASASTAASTAPAPPPAETPTPPASTAAPPAPVGAPSALGAPAAVAGPGPRDVDPAPTPSSRRPPVVVGLAPSLLVGLLPLPAIEIGARLDLDLAWARVGLGVSRSLEQRASLAARPTAGGTFSATSVGARAALRLEPSRGGRLLVLLGGGVALHRVVAEGFGVSAPTQVGLTTVSFGPTLDLVIALGGPVGARLGFEVLAPWPRRTYTLDGVGDLHSVPPVLARASLGLEARF